MGYTTTFEGQFNLDRPLAQEHAIYLRKFAETRRMDRNAQIAATFPDPIREAARLPIGSNGDYFVAGEGVCGQDRDDSVLNYNSPPKSQPGLWCQWVPGDDDQSIVWDGSEKFYNYVGWLEYIVNHFLSPWGYKLNGTVEWHGEEYDDVGRIVVKDNVVKAQRAKFTYEDEYNDFP